MKAFVETWLNDAIAQLKTQNIIPDSVTAVAKLTHTKDNSHGDFASNAALMLAKPAKRSPKDIATMIVDLLGNHPEIEKMEIVFHFI